MARLTAKMNQYGFAFGRVKVLETRLVNRARYDRMIRAENIAEAHRVLAETDYGPDLRDAFTLAEIEQALEKKAGGLISMMTESNVPRKMIDYFQCRFDFMNLRVLLKSGYGQEIPVELSDYGAVEVDKLRLLVRKGAFAGLPQYLEEAADGATAAYEKESEFDVIDGVLDRAYFAALSEFSDKLDSQWISGYTRLLIDLANGRQSLRAGQTVDRARISGTQLIEGGSVDNRVWLAMIDRDEDLPAVLRDIKDAGLKAGLTELLKSEAPVKDYDLLAGDLMTGYLLSARYFNVGPETVFAYIAAKENEIKMVRLILAGLLNRLAPESLEERLGAVYE